MKLLFPLVAASIASAVNGESLADKWSIAEPAYEWTASANLIELDYDVSTLMTDDNAVVKIYDGDCGVGGNEIAAGFTPVVTGLDGPVLSGTQFLVDGKTAELDLTLALDQLAQNGDLYSEATDGDGAKSAVIVFCIRFGLYTTGTSPLEVNFLENVITLNIDLTSGFEVAAFNVEPKDKIEATATQTYTVDAKLCVGTGADFAAVTAAPADETFNQGEGITVCVYPGAEAQQDGLVMDSILDFTWTRDDDDVTLDQLAIVSSAAETNIGLTEYDGCSSGYVCVFSTILLAQYYVSLGNVDGSGQATLAFPNAAVRRLGESSDSKRKLQEEAPPTLAEFDMNVGINAVDDGPGALAEGSGASVLGFTVTVMGLIGSLLL